MDEQNEATNHAVQGFNPAQLFGKGFNIGSADLIQGGSFREVVGRSVSALLLLVKDKDGHRVFKGAAIVLPPVTATNHTAESVFTALAQAIKDLRGFELDEQEQTALRRLVLVVNSPSLEVADLLSTLREQGKRCVVTVADASKYRDATLDQPATFGISSVRIGEDQWAPHVASICRQLVPIVKELEGYGLVHVPEVPAQKPQNVELLCAVDDCYVANLHYEADPEEVVSLRAQTWKSMVLQGRLADVMKEIEELALPDGARLHALAQLLRGTGRDGEMLDVIARLRPHLASLKAEATIQIARFAHQAGDDELLHEILPSGPDGVGDQVWLEEGLELSTYLKDNERIARFDARLEELFPRSGRLRENRDRRLLMNAQEEKSGELCRFTTAGFTDFHLTLQKWLSVYKPDYKAVIANANEWGQEWLELAVICCARHAHSSGNPREAAEAASLITSSELYGRQATLTLLWSIKSMMLKELVPEDECDDYSILFRAAFGFLAQHPEDQDVRQKLSTLLSVESCGDMGIPLVAFTMLDLAQQGVSLGLPDSNADQDRALKSDEAVESSMKNGFIWLGNLGASEPGVTVIPRELLTANPDDVVRTIGHLVHLTSAQEGEDADLEFMKKLVLLACATCPHATQERDEDIRLMRHLACQLTIQGQFQQARDLAEQILLMGQSSAYRRRLAWQAFGDIYHRCRNHVTALVGLACALAIDVAVGKNDLWHEVYAIYRVLRDLGLFELAHSFLPTMKMLLSELGFDADKDPRYVTAKLGLQLMEMDGSSVGALDKILGEIAETCRDSLGDRSNLLPLVLLLGQAVRKAEDVGVSISLEVRETLDEALRQVGVSMADMVRTISTAKPAAKNVLALFNSVERSAYASDVARDYALLELTARRLLDSERQNKPNPNECIFAIELLADHSVALVSEAPTMRVEWPAQYAAELNQVGLDVVFLALDSEGELTVSHISGGQAYFVEQPKLERSFRHRFHRWLQDYPKDYGRVDRAEGNNVFYLTMEALNVRLPQSERLVLVAEPFLQQLTANLIVMPPENGAFAYFAGTKAAIGIIPSLSWLSTARAAVRSDQTAYMAWISAEPDSAFGEEEAIASTGGANREELEREPTLDIALRRLSGCFEDFGFVVDTGRRLPHDMSKAGLVVVTAHGGLNSEGRYLHSIRDDGDLVEAPSALAAALAGVELVILFVCSGGRIDKNPWDNSTTSLPKQLLNNGSRAVIASPWPLDVMVTYNWLEPFMREWEAGSTVLDATKKANDVVARHLGEIPQYYLAMRVYGDVLLTKPLE
ncbi:CHAT domain-containing protein (plasmid) [Chromobacterium amazonense]|uniref:CHAT domain-containing protein n=1 Tax=Chromobacterium amazonense TaxID=1382803 RepID=UPI00237E089F|nr:CHAT domain-containing protein [Chromobacterium amazonense]MDE1713569.1 CHAT domain-containing protein [Chromobacterium amazonense]